MWSILLRRNGLGSSGDCMWATGLYMRCDMPGSCFARSSWYLGICDSLYHLQCYQESGSTKARYRDLKELEDRNVRDTADKARFRATCDYHWNPKILRSTIVSIVYIPLTNRQSSRGLMPRRRLAITSVGQICDVHFWPPRSTLCTYCTDRLIEPSWNRTFIKVTSQSIFYLHVLLVQGIPLIHLLQTGTSSNETWFSDIMTLLELTYLMNCWCKSAIT